MASSIVDKLRIKEGSVLRTLHPPENFEKHLQPLPADVKFTSSGRADQLHWFVKDRKQLEAEVAKVVKLVTDNMLCWVYYPKGSSKIQTDLTRDKGWDALLAYPELHWISLISFDETWSVFGFRLKTDADKVKNAKPQIREIFNYVFPETKTVKLPADLEAVLKGKPEADIFDKLSFTNKKEYIEWVITAKREDTRKQRVAVSMEKLSMGWKNPRNM